MHGGFHGGCNQDVRNLPAPLVQTSQQDPQTVMEPWHLCLAEVCNKALVSHHLEKAVEVAVAFGVAVPEELSEVADEICNQAVMKPLEPKRFLILFRIIQRFSFCVDYNASAHTSCRHARKSCVGSAALSAHPAKV